MKPNLTTEMLSTIGGRLALHLFRLGYSPQDAAKKGKALNLLLEILS